MSRDRLKKNNSYDHVLCGFTKSRTRRKDRKKKKGEDYIKREKSRPLHPFSSLSSPRSFLSIIVYIYLFIFFFDLKFKFSFSSYITVFPTVSMIQLITTSIQVSLINYVISYNLLYTYKMLEMCVCLPSARELDAAMWKKKMRILGNRIDL